MIHSMAGGVLGDLGVHTFAKVEIDGAPYWYLANVPVKEGQRVAVPFGRPERRVTGVVRRVEDCTAQTAPVPLSRARAILRVLPDSPQKPLSDLLGNTKINFYINI